ncbi:MAG: CBS domain-containing protein [Methanomicrobiales archaeon]|nr:CBS domain-containing protein [Methanomicrobiales archaeon]
MDSSLRIGSLFGIPVQLHVTFLLVIPLFAWIIGIQILPTIALLSEVFGVQVDSTLITRGSMPFILGGITSLGLFFGVFLHEVAHSLIAMRSGIRIVSITLLMFGGISSMEEGEPDPAVELPMALAGPFTSLAAGLIAAGLMYLANAFVTPSPVTGVLVFVFGYLALLNVMLFAFNLIPAFPMDGGRVLRAWLATRMPLSRATRIAATIGKVFAVAFGIIGLILINPFLLLIAFFIYTGASQEFSIVRYNVLLRDVTVGEVMSTPVKTIPANMPLGEILKEMYTSKHLGFPVVDHGAPVGMVTLADIHRAPPIDRDAMQARDIMTRHLVTLPPGALVLEAMKIMAAKDIGRVVVVEGDALVGVVTRTDIMKVVEIRDT